jgi:hypothetical protein
VRVRKKRGKERKGEERRGKETGKEEKKHLTLTNQQRTTILCAATALKGNLLSTTLA